MSCHDARERFSELIDDALDPSTRAAVDAHVSGCPECRRELDRLERTVVLLRAVEPVRAPFGFVDRVVAEAKPVPWYRRVGERLARVRPLGVPIEAVALVLVATLAVFVFEHTPSLQQAAREEWASHVLIERPDVVAVPKTEVGRPVTTIHSGDTPGVPLMLDKAARASNPQSGAQDAPTSEFQAATGSPAPPAPSETAPPPKAGLPRTSSGTPDAGSPVGRQETAPQFTSSAPRAPHGGLSSDSDTSDAARDAAIRPPAAPGAIREPAARADSYRAARDPGTRPEAFSATPTTPAPAEPRQVEPRPAEPRQKAADSSDLATSAGPTRSQSRARSQSADGIGGSAAETRPLPRMTVPYPVPPAAAVRPARRMAGRLAVADQETADRELAALLSRVGGAEIARRAEAPVVEVDVIVPGQQYASFASGLARIGTWIADAPPSDLRGDVTVTLRIAR